MTELCQSESDVEEIASAYLGVIGEQADEEHKNQLQAEIERYKDRREELVSEHGEDHKLVKRATQYIEEKDSELKDLEESEEESEELREKLLSAVADEFEFNDSWLKEEIIQAITYILYGSKDSSFSIIDTEIHEHEDTENIEFMNQIDMEEVIILLAEDCIGESDIVKSQWERLHDSTSFEAFEVLAENGKMSPKEVASVLDKEKSTVNNWLKNPVNLWDRLIPFYRPNEGEYALSTTGRYFAAQYWDGGQTPETSIDNESEIQGKVTGEQVSEEGESQQKLEEIHEGSGSSEKDEAEGGSEMVNVSSIESTDEKAEDMFSKISDSADTSDN